MYEPLVFGDKMGHQAVIYFPKSPDGDFKLVICGRTSEHHVVWRFPLFEDAFNTMLKVGSGWYLIDQVREVA